MYCQDNGQRSYKPQTMHADWLILPSSSQKNFFLHQVATALLVAGSTLTFWIPWQTPFASTSRAHIQASSFRALGCSYNCRWLTCGWFHLTHMSSGDHAVRSSSSEPWQPKRRQNIITALTTSPQGLVSARRHQCTTAITTMWTELLWAFLRGTLPDCALELWRTMGGQKGS